MFIEEWYHWTPIEYHQEYLINPLGLIVRESNLEPKNTWSSSDGYVRVSLNGHQYGVHVLVARMFVPGRSASRWQVNHIDGDKTYNYYRNLEWATPRENIEHVFESGIRQRKVRHTQKL